MFAANSRLNADYNNIMNGNSNFNTMNGNLNFNRYMYAYNLYALNHHLQKQLQNRTPNLVFEQNKPADSAAPNKPVEQPVQANISEIPSVEFEMYKKNEIAKNKIKYMYKIADDAFDSSIDNVAFLVKSKNKYIMVKETSSGKWMTPGGNKRSDEKPFEAGKREFKEETSFVLEDNKIISPIVYYDYKHGNSEKTTRIFRINTNQEFGEYKLHDIHKNETNDLTSLSIEQLEKKLLTSYFKGYVRNSLSHLISIGFIN